MASPEQTIAKAVDSIRYQDIGENFPTNDDRSSRFTSHEFIRELARQ